MKKKEPPRCVEKPPKPEHWNEIGFQVNGLSHLIHRLMHQYVAQGGEWPTHGWMLGYLYDNRDKDVYQRDLQAQFSVRRSTMTGILQLMEKNGMVVRQPVEWDARLKKITLTEKAIQHQEHFRKGIQEVEAKLSAGLTPEEREQFIALCEKIRLSVENGDEQNKGRKD